MKKYFAYAIGQVLVDLEWRITDEELKKFHLQKGVRYQIDLAALTTLQKQLPKPHAIHCGGSIANTCGIIANFNQSCFLQCKLANDEAGVFYLQELKKLKIETLNLIDTPNQHTGHCLVFVTPDAERTMQTYLGISNSYTQNDFKFNLVEQSHYLLLESYLFTQQTIFPLIEQTAAHAKKHQVAIVLSLSDPSIVNRYREEIKAVLPYVDFVFANQQEAEIYGSTNHFSQTKWIITQGANGVEIIDHDNIIHVPTQPPKKIIDKLGAGDAFAGAFLIAFHQHQDIKKAAIFGNQVAAEIISNWGARLSDDGINRLFVSL